MKKLFYLVSSMAIIAVLAISCEKSLIDEIPEDEGMSIDENIPEAIVGRDGKVTICHQSNDTWRTISVNANAVDAHLAHGDYLGDCNEECSLQFYQGFQIDTNGWLDFDSDWYGIVTRVDSGTDGIDSSVGDYHAIFEGGPSPTDTDESGPFTRFEGYNDVWLGTWTAEIDVYLDPSWGTSQGFDYSVAATGSDGYHQRDYIFHVNNDASTGKLLIAGSNNTNFAPREDLENLNHYEITEAGWYTFQHYFYDDGGALSVDLNLINIEGTVLFTETRSNAGDIIATEIGGNRYGWFTFINVDGGIAVDEHKRFECFD